MLIFKKLKQENNYLSSILFAMILVGYAIFAGITTVFGVEDASLSIIYRLIILVVASVLLFKAWVNHGSRVNYGFLIGASFLFFYITRMFFEWLFNSHGSKLDWSDFWLFLILVCLVPALPYVWKGNIPNESFTPVVVIIFGMIGLILNLYYISRVGDLSIRDQMLSGRLEGERLNPIAYGHLGVSTVLVSLWVLIIRKKINILTISGVVVGVLGVLASGSRGPFLSLVVCLVLIFMQLKLRAVSFIAVSVAICVAIIILSGFASEFDDILIWDRVRNSLFDDDSRNQILSDAYHAFLDNIISGAGYPFGVYPHNIVMEAFMTSGIIGGVLMVVTLAAGVVASLRLLKNKEFSWVSLLFIQYLLFSMVSSSIYYSNILWMLWVCVVTLSANMNFIRGKKSACIRIK